MRAGRAARYRKFVRVEGKAYVVGRSQNARFASRWVTGSPGHDTRSHKNTCESFPRSHPRRLPQTVTSGLPKDPFLPASPRKNPFAGVF